MFQEVLDLELVPLENIALLILLLLKLLLKITSSGRLGILCLPTGRKAPNGELMHGSSVCLSLSQFLLANMEITENYCLLSWQFLWLLPILLSFSLTLCKILFRILCTHFSLHDSVEGRITNYREL